MKKLHLLAIFVLVALTASSVNSFSQTKDKANTSYIVIDAKGGIHNHAGTKLGYIDKDNIVRNNKGKKIYFIDRNGNVISADGKNLGKAQKNGNYYNVHGENILSVRDKNEEMCEILDPKGHKLGTVHKNYKLHACATHCFFLKEKEKKNDK